MGELKKAGIKIEIIPTKQFKTVRIDVHFLKGATALDLAMRTLIVNVLETSTQKYKNQVEVTHALSKMYGANFAMGASRRGTIHDVGFSMLVANDRYVGSENLVVSAIKFLNEVINHPLVQDAQFDEATFERQKQNTINYVHSALEDKQYYAAQQIRQLSIGADHMQGIASYGLLSDLEKLDNKTVCQAFRDMVENDLVHISVSGDVDEKQILEDLKLLDLNEREVKLPVLTSILEPLDVPRIKEEKQDVLQARLNLAFNIPAYVNQDNYHTALVFNTLFGGSPQSKLFINVREKASLAYYASSNLDLYNGILNVQTGIEAKNKQQAFDIILDQIKSMKMGEVTQTELDEAKKSLRFDFLASHDLQRTLHRRALNNYLLNRYTDDQAWIDSLNQVTLEDVSQMAQQIQLRAQYFLSGE